MTWLLLLSAAILDWFSFPGFFTHLAFCSHNFCTMDQQENVKLGTMLLGVGIFQRWNEVAFCHPTKRKNSLLWSLNSQSSQVGKSRIKKQIKFRYWHLKYTQREVKLDQMLPIPKLLIDTGLLVVIARSLPFPLSNFLGTLVNKINE